MFAAKEGYTQLPVRLSNVLQAERASDDVDQQAVQSRPRRWSRETLYLVALVVQSVVFLGFLYSSWSAGSSTPEGLSLYSPATSLLREEIRVFNGGFKQRSIYQGVGEDVDRAWDELYDGTILRLPKSEAVQLPNKTWPIESDPGYYIAGLDVFHQLHCLNKIRKLIEDPESAHHSGHDHTSHCIESLRQYITCNIDVSVIIWTWSEEEKKVLPNLAYPHKCYNFEAIQEYAKRNNIKDYINPDKFVDVELPDPPVIHQV